MGWYRIENQGAGAEVQTKTVTASTDTLNVFPDEGYALSLVTVDPQDHTQTLQVNQRTPQYDLGVHHNTRYINTNSVPNSNTGTVQLTTRDTIDLGASNSVRYVDTTKVPGGAALDVNLFFNSNPDSSFSGGTVATFTTLIPQAEGTTRHIEVIYKDTAYDATHTIDFPWEVVYQNQATEYVPRAVIAYVGQNSVLQYRQIYITYNPYLKLYSLIVTSTGDNGYLIPLYIKIKDIY